MILQHCFETPTFPYQRVQGKVLGSLRGYHFESPHIKDNGQENGNYYLGFRV